MAFYEEAVISGFIGKVISDCVDVSWMKIKEAVKNRKNKHQNIESQIYNVIVDVLNQITYNKFKNDQDKIYQSAEMLLVSFKNTFCINIEVMRTGLQVLRVCVNEDKVMEFKILLYQELGKVDYIELKHTIELWQRDEINCKTVRIKSAGKTVHIIS